MRDFQPTGVTVLTEPISIGRIEELQSAPLSNIDKEIISTYLKGGKKKFLQNCLSSFHILGKYNLSEKYVIFGVILDEQGCVMGIDISQDNVTLETLDKRLIIYNDDDNLSRQLIILLRNHVGSKKSSVTENSE